MYITINRFCFFIKIITNQYLYGMLNEYFSLCGVETKTQFKQELRRFRFVNCSDLRMRMGVLTVRADRNSRVFAFYNKIHEKPQH